MKKMNIKSLPSPFIHSGESTQNAMRDVIIALLPLLAFSIYKNGWYALALAATSFFFAYSFEGVYAYFVLNKKTPQELSNFFGVSHPSGPALIFALLLPINTPIWVVAVGMFVALIVFKMLFGGFGYNIFNPAGVGRAFIVIAYGGFLNTLGPGNNAYLTLKEFGNLDAVGGVTALSNLGKVGGVNTYQAIVGNYGTLWDFFLGTVPGSMGETSALLVLIGFAYLVYKKALDYRITLIFIGTVFVMTWFVGIYNGLGVFSGIWYPTFHILSGGLMFGAVFMATEPVTSPTTPYGKFIFALFLGVLTVVARLLSNYPEGVLTAILTMNMLVPIIDGATGDRRIGWTKKRISSLVIILATAVLLTFYIADRVHDNNALASSNEVIELAGELS